MRGRWDTAQQSSPVVPAGVSHPKSSPPKNGELENPMATFNLHSNPYLIISYNCSPRRTVGKGWGVFAGEDILTGMDIILERPTFIFEEYSEETENERYRFKRERDPEVNKADRLRKEFEKLSKEQQMDIMSLHNSLEEYGTLYGIFQTNFFKVSNHKKLAGIYVFCSRLNHSCSPNCSFSISKSQDLKNKETYSITISARRDIRAGEQLTISYLPLKMRLGVRQDSLLMNHGFTCDCERCVTEGDKLYNWPISREQKVKLRFRPARLLQNEAGEGQGWDFLTIVGGILNENGTIQANEVIMWEAPLIALKRGTAKRNNSLLYDKLSNLSDSMRNKYLRLYNWRVGSESPAWESGPTYEVETTDDEEPTGWFTSWARKRKPLPSNATLFGIWEANSFDLDHEMEGVFAFTSHLNHSCWPTCRVAWHPEHKTLDIVSMMPLKLAEEITICYNHSEIFGLPFEKRQQYLQDNYGFKCCCLRCSFESIEPDVVTRPERLGIKSINDREPTGRADKTEQWEIQFAVPIVPEEPSQGEKVPRMVVVHKVDSVEEQLQSPSPWGLGNQSLTENKRPQGRRDQKL